MSERVPFYGRLGFRQKAVLTTFYGFLLATGRFVTIDVPGAFSTNALGINNSGEIVGITQGTAERGFLLSRGQFVTIASPGASSTQATGINDRGQVLGTFTDSRAPSLV